MRGSSSVRDIIDDLDELFEISPRFNRMFKEREMASLSPNQLQLYDSVSDRSQAPGYE